MNIGNYVKRYSEDLRLKNYSENTIDNYCSQVKCFLENFNTIATKPSEISEKQIKQWLLQAQSINGRKHRLSAVKLFYKLTGKQPLKFKNIEYPRSERKLPKVINKELTLKDREWTCSNCNTLLDRDVNASINIKNFALKNHLSVGRRLKNRNELSTLVKVMTSEAHSPLGKG